MDLKFNNLNRLIYVNAKDFSINYEYNREGKITMIKRNDNTWQKNIYKDYELCQTKFSNGDWIEYKDGEIIKTNYSNSILN